MRDYTEIRPTIEAFLLIQRVGIVRKCSVAHVENVRIIRKCKLLLDDMGASYKKVEENYSSFALFRTDQLVIRGYK